MSIRHRASAVVGPLYPVQSALTDSLSASYAALPVCGRLKLVLNYTVHEHREHLHQRLKLSNLTVYAEDDIRCLKDKGNM